MVTDKNDALWVTSWPFAEYVRHKWAGAWVCSCFRNEGVNPSSELNRQAVAATVWKYGGSKSPRIDSVIGDVAFVSFIDREKVKPIKVRGKETWGYTWRKCGWYEIGETQGGLLAFGFPTDELPTPEPPLPMKKYTVLDFLRQSRGYK